MARKRHTAEEIIGKLSAVYEAAPGPGLGRDGPAARARHRVGECLQAVRVPAYHRTDARRRVAGEPQASGAELAAGGAEGPNRQPKQSRLWFNDGSCVRRRAEYRDHKYLYDFVLDRTHDGRPLRMLTVVDDWTRECLAIDVARGLKSEQVQDRLAELFMNRGTPA